MAPLLVIALRLIVPPIILRWPFWGMLAAIAADASDVVLLDAIGWGFFDGKDYHAIDKVFDMYYLTFAAYASLRWEDGLARRTAIGLFLWRLAGFAAFEATRIRQVIFFAPNIFENFYLLVAGARTFAPSFRINRPQKLVIFLLIAAIPKVIQEYIMHFLEFPTWSFIKTSIFRWR